MTRFVYVLPAGRLRWEVRVEQPECLCGHRSGYHSDDWGCAPYGQPMACECESFTPATPDASLFYRRKAHALIAARAIALVIGGEVQPHNRWGRIQDPDSYGPDPERSVG